MPVEVKEVKSRKEFKDFLFLPGKIHHSHSDWVPPIYSQEWDYFNPQKNRAFSYSDCVLALAYMNGKTVGRIMGIINNRCNEYKHEKNARFGYLECWDNQTIANELLKYVENWAKARGMIRIVGPMGFNNQDPAGFLIIPILELMNECFTDLYGFQPLDNVEMNNLAKRFLPILDPRFVKIVMKDNQIIGFNIAMPNLSDGLRRAKGRLFPFGLFFILWSSKRTKQLDSLSGGIKEEYRGRGIDVMIGYTTIFSAQKAGFKFADSHHELEDNMKVRAEMERLGGKVYKRFRIYKKDL
jgi:hypothetical protein